jgi:hypothetical protein
VPPLKRPFPESPYATPPIQPLLPGGLPMAVWEDHLLPMLHWGDAARLACTCKDLGVVIREHSGKVVIGRELNLRDLKAVMTTFPRVRDLSLYAAFEEWDHLGKEALLQWLREGDRGIHLVRVRMRGVVASDFVHAALREGALPSLKSMNVDVHYRRARASLTGGLLGGMRELRIGFDSDDEDNVVKTEHQLAALGLVRQLPALVKLEVNLCAMKRDALQWPPFIPPSLKEFQLDVSVSHGLEQSLVLALPGMLEASGAGLERLEIDIPFTSENYNGWLLGVAQAVRCCSPTLRDFQLLPKKSTIIFDPDGDAADDPVQRLRVHWADVLAAVSTCRELEVLVLTRIEVEPLFSPGIAFARLTQLEVIDCERGHPLDVGAVGLWELMASGGLPALAKLSVRLDGPWMCVEEVKTRVAPALEAVAGTLTHLHLVIMCGEELLSDAVGCELGVAVGTLRRLKDLALGLSEDGRFYHAMAHGLAASGADALPLLWRMVLQGTIRINAEQAVSLLLPSVQIFVAPRFLDDRAPLLMACALRQTGYEHVWAVGLPRGVTVIVVKVMRAIVECNLADLAVHDDIWASSM